MKKGTVIGPMTEEHRAKISQAMVGNHNSSAPRRYPRQSELVDPIPEIVLEPGVLAGALWVPRLSEWRPAVLVGDEWYIGHETFSTSDEAIAVAKGRARLRESNGHE